MAGSGSVEDLFLLNNPAVHSSVLRRYSDFLWLYERLHVERSGAIVPPLPEKQAVSRFSPEFVEDRRRCLEKFLRRVILHPELWDSTCLLTFLRADDVAFQRAKNSGNSSSGVGGGAGNSDHQQFDSLGGSGGEYGGTSNNSGSGGTMSSSSSLGGAGAFNLAPKNAAGIKKWFSEAKTTFSGELVSSPDDDLFDEIERYVEALGVQMKRVSNQAGGLVRKSREIANGMFEFGLAFHQLGQSEGGILGDKLQLMGSTADALSSMAASQAEAELRRLEEPLRDYIRIIQGVRLALSRRHERRVSYTALLQEIQTREVNLHRLRMTPGSEARAYSTEMSLQRYHAAANASREGYAECSQRVLREVDRFKREKAEEMKSVVLDFILLEIEVNRAMERVWGDLVPKLEEGGDVGNVDDDGGGVGAASGQQQQQQIHAPQTLTMNAPPISHIAHHTAHIGPSAPIYSNVPNNTSSPPPVMAANTNTAGTNPMMEGSIQYREYNPRGMGY
jgi:sorting nexin-1/2